MSELNENSENLLITETSKIRSADEILDLIRPSYLRLYSITFILSLTWMIGAIAVLSTAFTASECTNCSMTTILDEYPESLDLALWNPSFFMFGMMIGALIFPNLADYYGRHPVLIVSLLGVAISGCLCALSTSVLAFCIFRTVQGAAWVGASLVSWVAGYELAPPKFRSTVTLLFGIMWVIGYCLVAPMAMVSTNWRMFYTILSAPIPLYALLLHLFIPETLHYLIVKKKTKRLQKWLEKEDETLAEKIDIAFITSQEDSVTTTSTKRQSTFIEELKRHKIFLFYWVVQVYMWMTDTFIYFGLSLNSTQLDGDPYWNFVFLGIVELPSYLFCGVTIDKLGRRPVVSATHIISGVSFLMAVLFQDKDNLICVICWIVGKLAISFAFMALFVYTSEIFPSNVRNGAVGLCAVFAKIGGIVIPYMKLMGLVSENLLLIVLFVTSTLAGLLCLLLPETKDRNLPDSLEAEFEDNH